MEQEDEKERILRKTMVNNRCIVFKLKMVTREEPEKMQLGRSCSLAFSESICRTVRWQYQKNATQPTFSEIVLYCQ